MKRVFRKYQNAANVNAFTLTHHVALFKESYLYVQILNVRVHVALLLVC